MTLDVAGGSPPGSAAKVPDTVLVKNVTPWKQWLVRSAAMAFSPSFWSRDNLASVAADLRIIQKSGYQNWQVARRAHQYAGAGQICSELAEFLRLLRDLRPRTIVELGVANGGTMCGWAQVAAPDAHLIGVDLGVRSASSLVQVLTPDEVEHRVRSVLGPRQHLDFVWGDSHSQPIQHRVRELLASAQVDFLMIDGDHSYEGVAQDFSDYSRFVRKGGIVAFHDIIPDHKTRYGIETGSWAGGVHQFWAEISARYKRREFVEQPEQDSCGIGVIWFEPSSRKV